MNLTIETVFKRFKFRNVVKYTTSQIDGGDHTIEIITRKGSTTLILPKGSINWIRRD